MLLQQLEAEQSAKDSEYEAGNEKDGAHPERHEFGKSFYVFLPEVLPRGPVLVCEEEKGYVVAPDPDAENSVGKHSAPRAFVLSAFQDDFRNQARDSSYYERVIGHSRKPHDDSEQDAHEQDHAELLHLSKEQHEYYPSENRHEDDIGQHEHRNKAEHGEAHDYNKINGRKYTDIYQVLAGELFGVFHHKPHVMLADSNIIRRGCQ